MPSANDPVVSLYGDRLGNRPTELTTHNRYPSSESGNGHEVKVEVHNHVHNHEKHSGATTVHHRDDFVKPQPVVNDYRTTNNYSTHNDNRSTTNNDNRSYSTTNTTTGKDHSAELAELKNRVGELSGSVHGMIAGQQAGRAANIEMPETSLPNAPVEHPSVSDHEPQLIEPNRNVSNLQFGNLGERQPYRM
jgi:hypothetical protein